MLKAASPRRLKRATSFATLRSLRNPAWRATRANETPWASARSALARRTRSTRSLVALTIRRRAACSAIVSGRSGSCWWVAISSLRPPGVSPMPSHASTHFRHDPLVGHLARASPLIERGRSSVDRTTSAGTGPAERVVAPLAAALASELALAGPDEGGGVGVPAARRRFEPGDDVARRSRGLAGQCTADEDALDRLGHVQPGAAERGIERHDAVGDQPQHERRGLVAAQIVEDQQHA